MIWFFFIYLIEKCSRTQLHSSSSREKFHFQHDWRSRVEKMKKKISNKNFRFWFTTSIFGARFLLLSLRVSRSKHNTKRDDTTTAWERSQNFNCLIFTTFQFYTDALTLCLVCTKHRISFTIDFRPLHSPSEALPYRLIWMHTNILCRVLHTQKKVKVSSLLPIFNRISTGKTARIFFQIGKKMQKKIL